MGGVRDGATPCGAGGSCSTKFPLSCASDDVVLTWNNNNNIFYLI